VSGTSPTYVPSTGNAEVEVSAYNSCLKSCNSDDINGGTLRENFRGRGGNSGEDESDTRGDEGGDNVSDGGDIVRDGGDSVGDGGDSVRDGGDSVRDGGDSVSDADMVDFDIVSVEEIVFVDDDDDEDIVDLRVG